MVAASTESRQRHRRWDDVGVPDGSGPVLVHPWLGSLRWYRPGQMIGSIDLDPAVRPPRINGHRDVEVLLHVMPGVTGVDLGDHVDRCAVSIRDALRRLAVMRQYTAAHAPESWGLQYAPESGTPADLLFLDGIEAGSDAGVLLMFDFGDLDQLVTRLDAEGNAAEVRVRA
jgi:hypothetical protein